MMPKRRPRHPGSNTERELNALRSDLQEQLLPSVVRLESVACEIARFLIQWGKKPQIRPLVAKQLAKHLVAKWPFASTKFVELAIQNELHDLLPETNVMLADATKIAERLRTHWCFVSIDAINRLIENQPRLLNDAVSASTRDEMERFFKTLPDGWKSRPKRVKPASDEERSQRTATSKRRYDRGRAYEPKAIGLIESEFGELRFSWTDPFGEETPSGPCLDAVLTGGEVKMAGDVYCLQSLFGFDRHWFPKSLVRNRRGRWVFYHLDSIMQCMLFFLDEKRSKRSWLQERSLRQRVLTGVIRRAEVVGSSEVAALVRQRLEPYVT